MLFPKECSGRVILTKNFQSHIKKGALSLQRRRGVSHFTAVQTPPGSQRESAQVIKAPAKIVVVDEHPGCRASLQNLLGRVGFVVLAAEDSEQGLALIRKEKPDLVIANLFMQNMDSLAFVLHLRREPDLAKTRVIVMLDAPLQDDGGHNLRQIQGGLCFVSKQAEPYDLLKIVDEVLQAGGGLADIPVDMLAFFDETYRALLSAARANEQRLASIVATAMDAILTIDIDQRIVLFNSAAETMFGCPAAKAVGSPIERFIPASFRAAHREHVSRFLIGGATVRAMGRLQPLLGLRANGEAFPIEASISKVQAGGAMLATVVIRDISARRAAEAALQESEQRLRLALQIGRIGTFEWNIVTNELVWSPEIAALYGFPAQGFDSTYAIWRERVHPEEIATVEQRVNDALKTRSFEGEWRVVWPDGTVHWLAGRAVVYLDEAGRPRRMVGVNIDITERKEIERRMLYAAQLDPLTGLPNRALLYEIAEHLLATIRRNGGRAAIFFVDLDSFKPINDTYGHSVGDAVLQEVARRMSSSVREADLVGRLGGDEFVAVLAPIRSEEDAARIALHFLDRLGKPYFIEGIELQVSPSIGISLFPKDGDQANELIKRADAAMYVVKQGGRNAFQFFRADRSEGDSASVDA